MTEQIESKVEPWSVEESSVKHDIRDLTSSDEDFEKTWQMWQTIFPKWPIERQRMEKLLHQLPGQHFIHEKGFCLSFLTDGPHGKIAAVGVLPEYRGKGLGTAFMKRAQAELRNVARANGEDFFLHRGTSQYSTGSSDQKF
jgi:beta-N-acetylhexosaminidase